MQFIIRRAKHSDAPAIIESHNRSIREVCSRDYSPKQIGAWSGRKLKTNLWCNSIDRDFIWVVEINHQVQGFGHLAIMSKVMAEVLGLYLTPEALGLGAGKELINIMKQEAHSLGIKELQLHSTITAKSFYEAQGFKQIAGDGSIEMQGVQIPCYFMSFSYQDDKCFR